MFLILAPCKAFEDLYPLLESSIEDKYKYVASVRSKYFHMLDEFIWSLIPMPLD